MQHPDEGTIHAWLDGELPYEESSRIAAHTESCEQCAALVAEARGFVAASSRILRQLDDVPGGVVPSTPGSNPVLKPAFEPRDWGVVLPIPRRGAHRRWFPSKFAAAAAITVMAVGAYTIVNRSHPPVTAPVVASTDAREQAAQTGNASARSDAAADQGAPVSTDARTALPPSPPALSAQAARAKSQPVPAEERERAARAKSVQAPAAAPKLSVPDPATVEDFSGRGVAAGVSSRAEKTTASAQFNDVVSRAKSADTMVAESTRRAAPLALRPDSVIESERRRLLNETMGGRLSQVVTTGVGGAAPQRLGTNPTVTTAPGCYDVSRTEDAIAAGVPASVRLADVQVRVGERTLRLAVPERAEPSAGENWYWSLGGGRILLHKVIDGRVVYEGAITASRKSC